MTNRIQLAEEVATPYECSVCCYATSNARKFLEHTNEHAAKERQIPVFEASYDFDKARQTFENMFHILGPEFAEYALHSLKSAALSQGLVCKKAGDDAWKRWALLATKLDKAQLSVSKAVVCLR